jgi:rhodanese-related sulfurtransferase
MFCAAASGCSEKITPAELRQSLKRQPVPEIIDVRSLGEYNNGHVPGAIHVPFWAVIARRQQINTSDQVPTVLYCEHGPRAVLARALLSMVGKEPFVLLEGHMLNWRRRGYPLEKGK